MTETASMPSVLFVCVKNGGKSQMAAGLMRKIAGDAVQVYLAGTKPGNAINDLSARALAEVGVDITGNTPTLVDPRLVQDVDVVVTLGRGSHRPGRRNPIRELGHQRTLRARHRRHRTHALGNKYKRLRTTKKAKAGLAEPTTFAPCRSKACARCSRSIRSGTLKTSARQ